MIASALQLALLRKKNQRPLLLTHRMFTQLIIYTARCHLFLAPTPLFYIFLTGKHYHTIIPLPHENIVSERLLTLYRLPPLSSGIIISALPTLLQRLPPADHLEKNTFILSRG
ncbi:hypothetical protein FIV31_07330 [Coxiella endosymbiont of Ornithodoros amblus]|uniref:hypothetical protein n=1 Tax=Coxiella endosymbiont of Ornithodoros amblus TaxID=1656166 RepID=UPI00244DFAB6|nr:hypothetical protein [Coxiella endosymbiont of Ornithodoros amblus]MBW5803062.1 hypothetical protein [Coxiella endosymbiont of Ornithodoros amblus]